jgi:hypothetical protein
LGAHVALGYVRREVREEGARLVLGSMGSIVEVSGQ